VTQCPSSEEGGQARTPSHRHPAGAREEDSAGAPLEAETYERPAPRCGAQAKEEAMGEELAPSLS